MMIFRSDSYRTYRQKLLGRLKQAKRLREQHNQDFSLGERRTIEKLLEIETKTDKDKVIL